jgi:aldose 1-epimerase
MQFEIQIRNENNFSIISLLNADEGVCAEIYSFGGFLNRFEIPVQGNPFNIVDGYTSIADAQARCSEGFQSVRLSPFVCRLKKGSYEWNGMAYQIEKKYMGEHAIHGLQYDAAFEVIESVANEQEARVELSSYYAGTDPGYPFNYHTKIIWCLRKDAELSVTTTVWHENPTPIPFAEGWHPYFTLGGKADEWNLQFSTSRIMEYDADLLPTGSYLKDSRFVNGCSLLGIQLDNGFVWEDAESHRFCTLSNSAISLNILPDISFPVLQVFIPDNRNSIALENLSGAPDNFNNQLLLIHLQPHTPKSFTTRYQVSVL